MSALPTRPLYDARHYVAAESVGHQLHNLMQLMRRELEARMAEHDLTDAQWKPLWALQTGRAGTANELARCIDMDPGATTRLVDRLVAKGLVERTRSDTDRRVVQLHLTPAGAEVVQKVPPVLAGLNNDFLSGFSVEEWQQLRQMIERMQSNGHALQTARAEGEVAA
jgi:DNA-binding MarR family transcriptional regulator